MNEGHNPYAPPVAEVKDAPSAETALASRGSRLAAVCLDTVVQLAVVWAVGLLLPWRIFDANPSLGRLMANAGVGVLIFLVLQGYLLVSRGQTVGKIMLSLRIVRSDGSRVGAARILGLRYILGYLLAALPLVGMLYAVLDSLLIFRGSRKCLHDQIADTIVVGA